MYDKEYSRPWCDYNSVGFPLAPLMEYMYLKVEGTDELYLHSQLWRGCGLMYELSMRRITFSMGFSTCMGWVDGIIPGPIGVMRTKGGPGVILTCHVFYVSRRPIIYEK